MSTSSISSATPLTQPNVQSAPQSTQQGVKTHHGHHGHRHAESGQGASGPASTANSTVSSAASTLDVSA